MRSINRIEMAMSEIWSKEVIAAFIGAAGAFWAALWVARDARRREERTSAMLVSASLERLIAFTNAAKKNAPSPDNKENSNRQISSYVLLLFPSVDPLFVPSSARIMPLHPLLTLSLSKVSLCNDLIQAAVARLHRDADADRLDQKPYRSEAAIKLDRSQIVMNLTEARASAEIARELIALLVFSRLPLLNAMRLRAGLVGSQKLKDAYSKYAMARGQRSEEGKIEA